MSDRAGSAVGFALALAFAFLAQAAAQPTPIPSPSPQALKVIEHTRTSAMCILLHQNVAQSVRAVLANDVIIGEFGGLLDPMNMGANAADDHFGNRVSPLLALDRVRALSLGSQLVQNLGQVDRLLSDPQFDSTSVDSDGQLRSIREALEQIALQQRELLNMVFGTAFAVNPVDLHSYGYVVQGEATDRIRSAPAGAIVGHNTFGAFAAVITANVLQTRRLEDVAATRIMAVAPLCR